MNDQLPSAEKVAGLTESQARSSEIELMVGRLSGLARSSGLSADQRIGVCMAQKVLEERRAELRARVTSPEESTSRDALDCCGHTAYDHSASSVNGCYYCGCEVNR